MLLKKNNCIIEENTLNRTDKNLKLYLKCIDTNWCMRTKMPLKLDQELNVYFLRMGVCSIFLLLSNERTNFNIQKAFSDTLP